LLFEARRVIGAGRLFFYFFPHLSALIRSGPHFMRAFVVWRGAPAGGREGRVGGAWPEAWAPTAAWRSFGGRLSSERWPVLQFNMGLMYSKGIH
jgi:hypothetical protein